jgi:thioredoxin 1
MPTKSSLILEATDETFASLVLNAEVPVLVEFWATWCPPCRMLEPVLAEIAAERAGELRVVKVNADVATETARDARVMAVPTVQVYSGGRLVHTHVGAVPKSRLLAALAPPLTQAGRL